MKINFTTFAKAENDILSKSGVSEQYKPVARAILDRDRREATDMLPQIDALKETRRNKQTQTDYQNFILKKAVETGGGGPGKIRYMLSSADDLLLSSFVLNGGDYEKTMDNFFTANSNMYRMSVVDLIENGSLEDARMLIDSQGKYSKQVKKSLINNGYFNGISDMSSFNKRVLFSQGQLHELNDLYNNRKSELKVFEETAAYAPRLTPVDGSSPATLDQVRREIYNRPDLEEELRYKIYEGIKAKYMLDVEKLKSAKTEAKAHAWSRMYEAWSSGNLPSSDSNGNIPLGRSDHVLYEEAVFSWDENKKITDLFLKVTPNGANARFKAGSPEDEAFKSAARAAIMDGIIKTTHELMDFRIRCNTGNGAKTVGFYDVAGAAMLLNDVNKRMQGAVNVFEEPLGIASAEKGLTKQQTVWLRNQAISIASKTGMDLYDPKHTEKAEKIINKLSDAAKNQDKPKDIAVKYDYELLNRLSCPVKVKPTGYSKKACRWNVKAGKSYEKSMSAYAKLAGWKSEKYSKNLTPELDVMSETFENISWSYMVDPNVLAGLMYGVSSTLDLGDESRRGYMGYNSSVIIDGIPLEPSNIADAIEMTAHKLSRIRAANPKAGVSEMQRLFLAENYDIRDDNMLRELERKALATNTTEHNTMGAGMFPLASLAANAAETSVNEKPRRVYLSEQEHNDKFDSFDKDSRVDGDIQPYKQHYANLSEGSMESMSPLIISNEPGYMEVYIDRFLNEPGFRAPLVSDENEFQELYDRFVDENADPETQRQQKDELVKYFWVQSQFTAEEAEELRSFLDVQGRMILTTIAALIGGGIGSKLCGPLSIHPNAKTFCSSVGASVFANVTDMIIDFAVGQIYDDYDFVESLTKNGTDLFFDIGIDFFGQKLGQYITSWITKKAGNSTGTGAIARFVTWLVKTKAVQKALPTIFGFFKNKLFGSSNDDDAAEPSPEGNADDYRQ